MPTRGNPAERVQPSPARPAARGRVHRLLRQLARGVRAASGVALFAGAAACGAAPDVSEQEVVLDENAARVLTGDFISLVHETTGTLRLEIDDDGHARVIFLDDFATDNGPALVVGLTATPASEMNNGNAWPEGTVDLGPLVGATGAQFYDVPHGTDVDVFESVVVWCAEFSVAFGAAPYTAADDS